MLGMRLLLPLTAQNLPSWHQLIGYVPQEPMHELLRKPDGYLNRML